MSLTGKQKQFLRALGHGRHALVQVGRSGVTDALVRALDEALARHELVKVRVGSECELARTEVADLLASGVRGEVAQILGRTLLLYRENPEDSHIRLPG